VDVATPRASWREGRGSQFELNPIVNPLSPEAAQNAGGGFQSEMEGRTNAASTVGHSRHRGCRGNPDGSAWDKGATPVEFLLSLQDSDGYFNETDGDSDYPEWMTSYAIPALLGEPYPVPPVQSSSGGGDGSIKTSPTSLKFYATEDDGDPIDRS
jgi:hypothetical protein